MFLGLWFALSKSRTFWVSGVFPLRDWVVFLWTRPGPECRSEVTGAPAGTVFLTFCLINLVTEWSCISAHALPGAVPQRGFLEGRWPGQRGRVFFKDSWCLWPSCLEGGCHYHWLIAFPSEGVRLPGSLCQPWVPWLAATPESHAHRHPDTCRTTPQPVSCTTTSCFCFIASNTCLSQRHVHAN